MATLELARDNHYVPIALLRQWSLDDTTLFARRLLVSDDRVPQWERVRLKGIGVQRDLYTSHEEGSDSDHFERWIGTAFEQPAAQAIESVVSGRRLSRDEWHALAKFFALQDLRTPTNFFQQMERWSSEMPALLEQTTREALAKYQSGGRVVTSSPSPFSDVLGFSVERATGPGETGGHIRTSLTLGRRFWLASMRHLLTGRAILELLDHKWSIVEAPSGVEWPLSDHPVLKLNYRSPREYDFGGGWRRRNTDLVMPLTPKHLLFVSVGHDSGRRLTLPLDKASELRNLLIRRGARWLFATQPDAQVVSLRPRTVDRFAFENEREMWGQWHASQTDVERDRQASRLT